MTGKLEIRESTNADVPGIEHIYPDAFPEEDLLPLVRDLLDQPSALSLVGLMDGRLVAHALFTTCGLNGAAKTAALLGPLAVAGDRRGQGIGNAIVRAGLRKLESAGTRHVFVLGDPAYYGRFGFEPNSPVAPPYELPVEWREAWQSLSLNDHAPADSGQLIVPAPWRQEALWSS